MTTFFSLLLRNNNINHNNNNNKNISKLLQAKVSPRLLHTPATATTTTTTTQQTKRITRIILTTPQTQPTTTTKQWNSTADSSNSTTNPILATTAAAAAAATNNTVSEVSATCTTGTEQQIVEATATSTTSPKNKVISYMKRNTTEYTKYDTYRHDVERTINLYERTAILKHLGKIQSKNTNTIELQSQQKQSIYLFLLGQFSILIAFITTISLNNLRDQRQNEIQYLQYIYNKRNGISQQHITTSSSNQYATATTTSGKQIIIKKPKEFLSPSVVYFIDNIVPKRTNDISPHQIQNTTDTNNTVTENKIIVDNRNNVYYMEHEEQVLLVKSLHDRCIAGEFTPDKLQYMYTVTHLPTINKVLSSSSSLPSSLPHPSYPSSPPKTFNLNSNSNLVPKSTKVNDNTNSTIAEKNNTITTANNDDDKPLSMSTTTTTTTSLKKNQKQIQQNQIQPFTPDPNITIQHVRDIRQQYYNISKHQQEENMFDVSSIQKLQNRR